MPDTAGNMEEKKAAAPNLSRTKVQHKRQLVAVENFIGALLKCSKSVSLYKDGHAMVGQMVLRVMSLMRGMRGGRDYDSSWGRRMTGEGAYAELIAKRFDLARRRLGLAARDWSLDTTRFRPPPRPGDQLTML